MWHRMLLLAGYVHACNIIAITHVCKQTHVCLQTLSLVTTIAIVSNGHGNLPIGVHAVHSSTTA